MSARPTDPGPEWAVLEELCRADPNDGYGRVRELAGAGIDFDVLNAYATKHRIRPLLAHALVEDGEADLTQEHRDVLSGALDVNRRQTRMRTEAAVEATRLLNGRGVVVVATKGVILNATVYGDRGVRQMHDADLMIHPESREAVAEGLADLGYRNGIYKKDTHVIEELPQSTRRLYRLSPSHLPHFVRLGERPGEVQDVDVANSITWTRGEWQVPMTEVLARTVTVKVLDGEAELPALEPDWHFVFVALHLFRESWLWRELDGLYDLLSRYADILRLWRRDGRLLTARLPELIKEYRLERPMAWVLGHTDLTFGSTIVDELGLAGAASDEWLHTAQGPGGQGLTWTGTMRDRLYRNG